MKRSNVKSKLLGRKYTTVQKIKWNKSNHVKGIE